MAHERRPTRAREAPTGRPCTGANAAQGTTGPGTLASCRRLLGGLWLALALLAAGCASLPPPSGRSPSSALTDTADTLYGRSIGPKVAAHPGLSGFHALELPLDAFAARVLLAAGAQRSIDVQYYIWKDDTVGTLLWQALWQAAERGVRVRMLLDDANTSGLDGVLAVLDAHPNIEVRLYNPFVLRGSRAWGYLSDFGRLNRRMHNKSFTTDNQVTVVGGRNIADEYFGAADALAFADVDLLAIGPVVQQVSTEFDLYWNSLSAYPAAPFVGAPGADGVAALEARFAAVRADPEAARYVASVQRSGFVAALLSGRVDLQWAPAQVLYDDPAKTLDVEGLREDVLLFPELVRDMGRPSRSVEIVSPYFVPGDEGTAALAQLAQRGVRVRVLTNSLASSDERIVHAGYVKRRMDLLRAGVRLYELRPGAADAAPQSLHVKGRFGAGKVSGLHAKSYAVDERSIFVGSFNFDQRSARLNTEMGVIVQSPDIADVLAKLFDEVVPFVAYEVRIGAGGTGLEWVERDGTDAPKTWTVDPHTSGLQRLVIDALSGLPIDWLL